jgi:hypothetical protein
MILVMEVLLFEFWLKKLLEVNFSPLQESGCLILAVGQPLALLEA